MNRLLVLAFLLGFTVRSPAQIAPRADTNGVPFVRLFTVVGSSLVTKPVNNLPEPARTARLDALTRWYVHFHGESAVEFPFGEPTKGPASQNLTLAERLAQRGAMVSNYRNGSYVSPARRGQPLFGEAADLESRAPLAIATWWPGQRHPRGDATSAAARLVVPADGNTTTIMVTSTGRVQPQGAPDTWPYLPSRGTGLTPGNVRSDSTADFVSWVRVGDEIMRVRSVTAQAATIALGVDRAYFGTTRTTHAAGTRVMSPVYTGSIAAPVWDRGFAGTPTVNNPQTALRYGVKIWQDESAGPLKDGIGWLAGRIAATFGASQRAPYFQGHNAVWLDATGCTIDNFADAYAQPVAPWDDTREFAIGAEALGEQQTAKVRGLRSRLAALGYTNLMFVANDLASFAGGADCNTRLLAGGGFDAGSLERWLQNAARWEGAMNQHLSIQAQNLPAVYWLKWNELAAGQSAPQYKHFAYGSYLLGLSAHATRPRLGGPFGLGAPDELFFWNFGAPTHQPTSLLEMQTEPATRAAGAGVVRIHRRNFPNGSVIVNATAETLRCNLRQPFFNVLRKDAQGRPLLVNAVEIPPHDAAFLLKSRQP